MNKFLLILFYCLTFFLTATSFAQSKFERFGADLYGESIVGVVAMPHTEAYAATATSFYGCDDVTKKPFTKIWETPKNQKIFQIIKKNGGAAILLLLKNGDSYQYTIATRQMAYRGHFFTADIDFLEKMANTGNSILTRHFIYSSSDNGLNWNIDTAGFNSKFANDMCLDTAGNIYAITDDAVIFRHRDSTRYTTVSTFPSSNPYSNIFIDRTNTFYAQAGSDNSVYISKDKGVHWEKDLESDIEFIYTADDAYGNVYLIGTDFYTRNVIMRRDGKNGTWSEIQHGILQITRAVYAPYYGISADSIIIIGSSQGVFLSDYQLYPWQRINEGISSEWIGGIARSTSGDIVTSNNIALFSLRPSASTWEQLFPKDADALFSPVYSDYSGSIFAQTRNGLNSFPIAPFWQSDDDGEHWKPDTLGSYIQAWTDYSYVDRLGGIHLVYNPTSVNKSTILRSLKKGGRWEYDTTNLQAGPNSYLGALALGNDNYFYASLSANGHHIVRRELNSKIWEQDIAPVPDSLTYFAQFVAGKEFDLYGVIDHQLYKRSNNQWKFMPLPQSVPPSSAILRIGYDSSGRLYSAIENYGVFISSDDGLSWRNAGLDSIIIMQFHSYGDTTFAISLDRGMYRIINGTDGAVRFAPTSSSSIHLAANPVTISAQFNYELLQSAFITLRISDALGREVATVANEFEQSGIHTVNWNPEVVASGIYYFEFIERENNKNIIRQNGTIIVKH